MGSSSSTLGLGLLIFDVFASVLLYLVVYFFHLRILRRVRLGNPVPSSRKRAYIALILLVVAFVSLSPTGVDIRTLIVFLVFFASLLFFIAIPSLAFRPSPHPLAERLAKHLDVAALGVLLLAGIAWAAAPNHKLQAVLATAILVEVLWFARCRYLDRGRAPKPLSDFSLAVLRKQANGDLPAFKKKHRIGELIITDSHVNWLGCTRESLPCPISFYVNRLGLNTPDCCREHMAELCLQIIACLKDLQVTYWIDGGTLLGAVRENGNLLAWEDDVDISLLFDEETSWKDFVAAMKTKLGRNTYLMLHSKHWIGFYYDRPRRFPFCLEQVRARGEVRVDLIPHGVQWIGGRKVLARTNMLAKGGMPVTDEGNPFAPYEFVLPASTMTFLGETVHCPRQPHEYLRLLYGDYTDISYTYLEKHAADARRELDMRRAESFPPIDRRRGPYE